MPSCDGPQGHLASALREKSVLFVTGFTDIESRLDGGLLETPTVFVTTVDEAYEEFDSSVAVVCVTDNILDDQMEQFRTDVLGRHPLCQFIAIESQTLANDRIDSYDVILQGPVSKNDFQVAVHQRLKYELYSTLLQEYYLFNMRAMALRRLNDNEDTELEYIRERVQQLCPQLQALRADLSEDQIREISRTVERHKDYLNQPVQEPEESGTSKYHPPTCPECGVAWGTDHGNELRSGFESLGAGVRKCSHCGEIVHALHDSNQRVMKG